VRGRKGKRGNDSRERDTHITLCSRVTFAGPLAGLRTGVPGGLLPSRRAAKGFFRFLAEEPCISTHLLADEYTVQHLALEPEHRLCKWESLFFFINT
jgi:hypothetical protein